MLYHGNNAIISDVYFLLFLVAITYIFDVGGLRLGIPVQPALDVDEGTVRWPH
jgi:hypothetical protein